MKNYIIHLKAIEDKAFAKSTKKLSKENREKGFALARAEFDKAVEENIQAKDILFAKEQTISNAVILSIKETSLDKMMAKFRALDVVLTIEAEYSGPIPLSER